MLPSPRTMKNKSIDSGSYGILLADLSST